MCRDFANFVDWMVRLGEKQSDKVLMVGYNVLNLLKDTGWFTYTNILIDKQVTQVVGTIEGHTVVYCPLAQDGYVYQLNKSMLDNFIDTPQYNSSERNFLENNFCINTNH